MNTAKEYIDSLRNLSKVPASTRYEVRGDDYEGYIVFDTEIGTKAAPKRAGRVDACTADYWCYLANAPKN